MAPPLDEAPTLPVPSGDGWTALRRARLARWLLGLAWPRPGPGSTARAHRLARDGTLAFRPGRAGLTLTCESGVFLVTQEGDPEDHVLGAGDAFRTRTPGRVVAWAFQAGVLIGPARR